VVGSQLKRNIALDITISSELKQEGIARELVNRIQNIRKDSGFEVTDKIKVQLKRNGILEEAILVNEGILNQKH
jgi:isoleucyl-tRNA synthetase